ncbi:MAG TPA: calcium-binding protein [Hyphomicrobium sp.]|nr:calcium-binding protein [Hyphomicrobium sp.]
MPCVRIEWIPVQLSALDFDHLQLVYQPDDLGAASRQDDWYVMEGVREVGRDGTFLGIEGANGRTTLAVANLAAREALIAKIGTPELRGSRRLACDGAAFGAWETMASYARDIEEQDYPYIAYGLPGSPTPTINSSSAIASLIHYSGLETSGGLPFGLHMSPGTTTLLGTGGNDILRIDQSFTTLLGGRGTDEFFGGSDRNRVDKFYGGEGDDLFHWSPGFNIVHGGQPGLPYAHDGLDVMDYSGAGTVHITFNRYWIPHKVPNYVVVFPAGVDHLFSIERIQWNDTTDRVVLGKGVDLIEDDVIFDPSGLDSSQGGRAGAAEHVHSARLVSDDGGAPIISTADYVLADGERNLELVGPAVRGEGNALPNRLLGDGADNILVGHGGDDVLYGGPGDDELIGSTGSDTYVYLDGDGNDVIVDEAAPGETDELVLAGGIEPREVSFYRPAQSPDDLGLALAKGGSILIEGFLASPSAGIERVVFDRDPASSSKSGASRAKRSRTWATTPRARPPRSRTWATWSPPLTHARCGRHPATSCKTSHSTRSSNAFRYACCSPILPRGSGDASAGPLSTHRIA